jgi:hypothetical protein
LAVLAAIAGNARAAEAPVKAVVYPGSLSLGPARDITSPSERNQGVVRRLVEVIDARGNGGGWILAARAPAATRILDVTIRCGPGSTCTLPGARPRVPVDLRAGRPLPLLAAERRTGMGRIDVTVTFAAAPIAFSLRPA